MVWNLSKSGVKKTVFLASTAVLLVACSSPKNKVSTVNTSKLDHAGKQKFGAVYKGRQYLGGTPYVYRSAVNVNKPVVNSRSFLQQLANVRAYSSSITGRNAGTYGKLSSWVASGANIQSLKNYGIQVRQLTGEEGFQNILMTGYYSPVVKARAYRQGKYQHPIYALPRDKRYTRAQIYRGALAGKGLELAYSDSMLDNFLLGVQGSGYVDFGDGRLNYFAYAGQNGFPYVSIGRLLVEDGEIPKEKMSIQAIREWGDRNPSRVQSLLERNPSQVFFKRDPSGQVKGSAGVPLVPLASVASDNSIIPSGTVLLVETPVVDNNGNFTGKREMRLMIALDKGGAVNGQHFDLYQGIGDKAGHAAGHMKHYGRAWILQ